MMHWREYWNGPARVQGKNFLEQVGKTVNGRTIPDTSVNAIVKDIAEKLQLRAADRVLDLCCGNGVLTHRCAALCSEIVAVDFSAPLIAVASANFAAPNIRYFVADVSQLPHCLIEREFSKICMYEGLQHLTDRQAEEVLMTLRQSSAAAPVFFGSVPDKDRLWNYYDTQVRREEYERRVADGTEAIGHWWTQPELASLVERCGYTAHFTPPNPVLHVAHYRFDVLCRPA
jgi:2-polyprenyl-3-methyl-5-hydroxy-6-metoxy-1,4-benzoquinol methylase